MQFLQLVKGQVSSIDSGLVGDNDCAAGIKCHDIWLKT